MRRTSTLRPLGALLATCALGLLATASLAQNRIQNGSFEVSHDSLVPQKILAPTLGLDDLDYWCYSWIDTQIWSGFGATNGRTAVLTEQAYIRQDFNLFGCTVAMSQPFTDMPNVLLFDAMAQRPLGQPHFSTVPGVLFGGGTPTVDWDFTAVGTASPIHGWRTLARVFRFAPLSPSQEIGFNDNYYHWPDAYVLFDNFYLFNCRDIDPNQPRAVRGFSATNGTATSGHLGNMAVFGDSRVVKLSSGTSKQCGIILAGYVGPGTPSVLNMTYDISSDPDCGPVYAYVSIYDYINQRWRSLNPTLGPLGPIGYPINTTNTFRVNTVTSFLGNHVIPLPALPSGPNNLAIWKIDFSPFKDPLILPPPGGRLVVPCMGVDVDRIQVF